MDPKSVNAKILNLSKIYRKKFFGKNAHKLTVKNLSFKLNKGEIFSLLGPNGAGKSTILKLLLNQEFSSAGKVRIAGDTFNSKLFLKVGYCPQETTLIENLTVREQLDIIADIKGLSK